MLQLKHGGSTLVHQPPAVQTELMAHSPSGEAATHQDINQPASQPHLGRPPPSSAASTATHTHSHSHSHIDTTQPPLPTHLRQHIHRPHLLHLHDTRSGDHHKAGGGAHVLSGQLVTHRHRRKSGAQQQGRGAGHAPARERGGKKLACVGLQVSTIAAQPGAHKACSPPQRSAAQHSMA